MAEKTTATESEFQETPVSQTDKELTFVLKISQTNIILSALDEIPHKLSRAVIDSLKQQAVPQLQEQAA